jgi:hypothetical protein
VRSNVTADESVGVVTISLPFLRGPTASLDSDPVNTRTRGFSGKAVGPFVIFFTRKYKHSRQPSQANSQVIANRMIRYLF